MNEFIDTVGSWLLSSGLRILIVLGLLLFLRHFGAVIIRRIVGRSVRSNAYVSKHEEEQRENTLVAIVSSIVSFSSWFIAILIILGEIGVNLGPFIAGASILGVALGFGAQSLVKDFVSGMFIILENQYRVGDIVKIAGVSGRVVAINIRDTVLRDLDGHVHYIPNGKIEVATNMTMQYSAINLNLEVGYETDIGVAQQIIDNIGVDMSNDPEWREYFIKPIKFIRVQNFGESAVELKVIGRVQPGKQWMVAGEFRRLIKIAFDKHQIEIPFAQHVIHQGKPMKQLRKTPVKKSPTKK